MRKQEVVEFFGSVQAAAKAIGISSPAISQWGDEVPKPRERAVMLAMRYEQEERDKEEKKQKARARRQAKKIDATLN